MFCNLTTEHGKDPVAPHHQCYKYFWIFDTPSYRAKTVSLLDEAVWFVEPKVWISMRCYILRCLLRQIVLNVGRPGAVRMVSVHPIRRTKFFAASSYGPNLARRTSIRGHPHTPADESYQLSRYTRFREFVEIRELFPGWTTPNICLCSPCWRIERPWASLSDPDANVAELLTNTSGILNSAARPSFSVGTFRREIAPCIIPLRRNIIDIDLDLRQQGSPSMMIII